MSGRTRPKCKRSVRLAVNPVVLAIERARKLPKDLAGPRFEEQRAILDEFLSGKHCQLHWLSLADMANMAESLSAIGICSDAESLKTIGEAQSVLAHVHGRAKLRRSWTTHAAEQATLRQLLWLHGVQLQHCSGGEYRRAWDMTVKRVSQDLAGNASPGTIVVHGLIGNAAEEAKYRAVLQEAP